jgi:hypothetical protein
MEKEKDIFLEVENVGVKGIKFSIDGKEKLLSLEGVEKLRRHINSWFQYAEHWSHYIRYYNGYGPKKIKKRLDQMEKDYEDYKEDYPNGVEYEIGENFAQYLEIVHENGYHSNNEAAREVKKMFKKDYPDLVKNLNFDPESSYCYVYTKDRYTAEVFKQWSYDKIIKPKLDEIEK